MEAWNGVISVAIAIVGLAMIAVILSKQANTANVIGAAGEAFSNSIGAAVAPITGGGLGGSSFNSSQFHL